MAVSATITKFCHGIWQLESQILFVESYDDGIYVITEETPFHPVSHIWPDHPADKGCLRIGSQRFSVFNCLVGAIERETETLYVGEAIPVKRDEPGWSFVVVHCINADASAVIEGERVCLSVDRTYQEALSRGHSAGHLAFLALNKVLTRDGYWRKDADRKDAHGNYDFNSYAQVTSFVTEDCCVDTYRLGKTLRKRGLNSVDMLTDLQLIVDKVNDQLTEWLAAQPQVEILCHGETLTDSRYWQCDLGEGELAVIPCGGTHVSGLADFAEIKVSLTELDAQNIEMQTDVKPS
ncbi:alanyl-tRNA editing protein [Vibrio sp. TRT 21S02]|uniref:alanyl-tRNA editing protein n=1 Tax=Vibrio sp. TRT 21S02 TaxID=3418507 RepID=UPI003CED3B32